MDPAPEFGGHMMSTQPTTGSRGRAPDQGSGGFASPPESESFFAPAPPGDRDGQFVLKSVFAEQKKFVGRLGGTAFWPPESASLTARH